MEEEEAERQAPAFNLRPVCFFLLPWGRRRSQQRLCWVLTSLSVRVGVYSCYFFPFSSLLSPAPPRPAVLDLSTSRSRSRSVGGGRGGGGL